MASREIPEEVLIDILIRLPVKSLMRFKCVSRIWLSLITSRYFTNLYLKSSSHRRVFLYAKTQSEYALLTSSTHDHSDTTSVSVFDQDWTIPGMGEHFLNADRGLVCFQAGTRVRIGNLNTRQLVELPIVINSEGKCKSNDNVWYYLGHDPVHDEYKVLSIVWELDNKHRVVRSEHRVLVLGAGASWKKTKCHITHRLNAYEF
ncbi:PREDICTED: putative F-box protein At3g52320 [Camelina sativa]|uniref:F-box protein At3g52320 n=1 Tax=Camelina sativa TaxID=90675 RepID=A0ABM0TTS2_CAMSA|nr:PREDICTED: putative F-box protein At3g52320 [Camelina sativa]